METLAGVRELDMGRDMEDRTYELLEEGMEVASFVVTTD